MPRIQTFISYSRNDKDEVRRLLGQGVMRGITPWIDLNNNLRHAGQELPQLFIDIIKKPETVCLTLFLSEQSIRSDWVRQELELACTLNKRVIIISLSGFEQTKRLLRDMPQSEEINNPLF